MCKIFIHSATFHLWKLIFSFQGKRPVQMTKQNPNQLTQLKQLFDSWVKNWRFLKMSSTEKTLEASLQSTEFEHQALVITVPNDYEETVSPQSSFSDFSQIKTPFTEVNNSLHGSNASLDDEMEFHEPSKDAPLIVKNVSKTPQKL